MTLSVTTIDIYNYKIVFLYPDIYNNISIQFILLLENELIPNNVEMIQTTPTQALYAQFYVAISIGMIASLPLIVKEYMSFIYPALYTNEKKVIRKVILPVIILFLTGCSFAFFVAIPLSLAFLYEYGQSMGVISFFEISTFITFVVNFLIVFGLAYQIPLLMWGLTKAKILKQEFWKNNIVYVIILIVILGALVTPDASGITMWLVAGPLILLYLIGLFALRFNIS